MPKESTHVNQYSDPKERPHKRYRWLISSITKKSSPLGFFECWEVEEGTRGFDEANGYLRISYNGRKVFAHVFVWEYQNRAKKPEDQDISHLCHNRRCCNPAHLHPESRAANKSRDHCIGVASPDPKGTVHYRLCSHQPACCTDALLRPL